MDINKNNETKKDNETKQQKNETKPKQQNNNVVVKKELNYDRIKKILKNSKNSKKDLKEGNLKIIKIIISQFHHKIKRTSQTIFDLLI